MKNQQRTKGKVNVIDLVIGANLQKKRRELNMSQEELGSAIGVTFQQIQKYEKGTNRLSASRLIMAAYVLNVELLYFFSDDSGKALIETKLAVDLPKNAQDVLKAFDDWQEKS